MANWWDTDAADAPAQQPEQPQWWSADAADAPAPAASGPLPVAQQNEPGWRGQSPNPVIRPDGPQPLPLTPPPNGGTYQGGVAVRPILGHDEQYAPTGQTHIPTQGMFGAAANSLMQGAIAGTADIGAGGIRLAGQVIDPEEAAGRALSGQKPLPDWAATDKLADTVSGAGQSLAGNFPVDSDLAKKSWVKGASMIGGGLPYLAAAAVSGPAGWFSAGAAGAAQTYESIYKEAVAHGASPDQAHADALIPALLSAPLMSVQAGVLLKGLPFGMQQALLRPIVDTAASSGTMVGVSELQKLIANANAQNTYDPSRPTLEGVGEDIVPEAMAGAALHGAAMAGHGVRAGVEALRQPDAAPELRVGAEGIREAGEWYQQDRPAGEAQASPQAAPEQPPAPEPAPATEQATAPAREAAAPIPQGGFERRAGSVMSRLQADLGLTPEQAAGVVGNLGHESGLQEINERHPIVPGSRGGFGWAQWTGPRRDAFEQFAKENGMSVTDPEANYQFLVHELTGPESGALDALRKTGTVEDATRAFVEAYERPKVVAMGSRLDFARKALGAEAPEGGQSGHAAQGEAVAQRVYAGDIGVDVRPEVVELSDLVASHDADGRVNPEYPHEDGLQPRDRTTVGSQTQVREIASKLNPELLKPQPDASGGAPIVSPKNVVENGNGRIAALSLAYSDPSLADRAADYRNMLSTMGFDIEGMKQPVLVSRRLTPLAGPDLQQFVKNTADRTTLAMNPAERARADATLAGRAIDLWQGREAGAAANAPFVRAFMQGIPASERGNMIGSDGRLSAAGEKRVQGAVVAHAYGDQLGPTLDRFVTGDAEGLKAIAGGLNDAAGAWAQMRSEASKGHVPAALDITGDLAHAVQIVDQARQTGRPVPELLAQHDLDRPVSPMTAELVRGFYRDDGMTKPAGREAVADRLRAYAEEAAKTPDGNDMFGAPPPPAPEVLKAASLRLAQRKLSGRDGAAARAAGARDEKGLPEDAATARERLRVGAQAMMRFLGLPPEVGLRLVDKIVAGAHGADGAYTHGLIELALDTKPADLPAKLFHESVHALLDPKLELLTKGQREALMAGADGWLRRGDNRARVEALYGKDRALVREEAVARMGEEAFKAGLLARSAAGRVYSRLVNAVRGLGQVLRGQGYATADDVFRGVLRGDRALPGSREALLAAGPRDPMRGMMATAGVPNGAAAADDRQMAQPERQQTPTAAPQDAADSGFTDPTARAIAEIGAAPERYMALRDEAARKDAAEANAERVFSLRDDDAWSRGGGTKQVRIGKTDLTYGVSNDGKKAEVILVRTPKAERGQGEARKAMEAFIAEADRRGMLLTLNSHPMDRGVSKARLDAFYRSLGFVKNMGRNKDFSTTAEFIRQPKTDKQYALRAPETPEFKRWFGESKVVDESGKPLVVYHGTGADIDAFDQDKAGRNIDSGFLGKGVYFTDKPSVADYYASAGLNSTRSPNIIPAHLKLENPFRWGPKTQGIRGLYFRGEELPSGLTAAVLKRAGVEAPMRGEPDHFAEMDLSRALREELISRGHDGVVAEVGDGHHEYVAFHPEQIKSAISNRGTYDPNDPRIQYAKRERDEAPLLSDRAGLERAGQLAIPGAERDERGALQRRADAPLAKGGQKAADDLPLFDHMKRDQPSLFALRAYHGSPWDFDRFDIGKIGTGEGAQAYGHGLYYAESEKVAKSYRDALSKGRMPPDDVMRRYFKPGEIVPSYGGRDRVIAYKNDPTWGPQITVQAVDADGNAIGRPRTHSTVPDQKQIDQVLRIRGEEGYDPGHLYEVNLHVEPHELLDWDKPLSEQSPQVQDLLPKAPDGVKQLPNGRWATTLNGEVFGRPTGWPDRGTAEEVRRMMREDLGDTSKWTGSDLHQYLVRRNPGNPARPAELMREAGIPGIRYRDAMSRDGRDDGTHNFVMFSHDPVEIVRKYSLRQNLTTALRDNTEEPRRVLAHALDQALFPMRLGSKAAQAAAFKFAQALRGIGFRYGQIDRQLVKQFTPEDRAAMGRALDAQSVFEQRVRSGEATEADRAAFDASKQGLAGLNDKQRQTVQALNQLAQQTWKRLQDRKLVKPDAEGLPAYMPRQFVMMDGLTGARRITPADNKIDGGDAAGGGGGGLTSMDQKGRNLTTAGPQRREYLTPEESERAAKAKFGDNATLVTDIRSLVDALQRQERAIAGRDMVDAIKRIGAETGIDLVREGEAKPDRGYFTLDHPALREYRVAGTDADGKPIYTRADIHIAEEFRGPLEAVLSQPAPDWYRGLMRVKGASMTAIMFSPYMHRMVEYGRAFPLLRTGIFRATSRGETLQRDRGYMDQAIRDGLAPIASGFRGMDAASIMDEAAGLPAKNVVSRALSRIDEVAARGVGKVLGENAADTYLHPHEKLLWDKVRNLQVGIYAEMRDRFIAKGFSERGAGIMAAHLANRYAGALPSEHLSRFANMAANLAMFSRSFTLGNLAVAKDMLNGAPSHVRAALADAVGGEEAQRAQKALQRKAVSAFVLDIGMMYGLYALAQSGFTALRSQQQGDDLNETARKVWQEYVDGQSPAQGGYEPGKGNRAYIGNDTSGRGIYARLAAGKVAEDLVGWTPFAGHPGTMLLNKMNPLIRATWESVVGKDSLDRPVYRPNPQTMLEKIGVARDIALHIAGSMVPADFLQQTYEMAKGEERGDKGVAAARILAPLSGVGSISSGNKNGPEAGREQAVVANAQYDRTKARAEATRLYNLGREDEARSALEAGFGNDARAAAGAWRSIVNPARAQVRLNRSYQRITANP